LFLFALFFGGHCQPNGTTVSHNLKGSSNLRADSCNLTYTTYTSISSPSDPVWIPKVIIVSQVVIGTNPVVSNIGFYVSSQNGGGDGYVDLLIYDSNGSQPGTLLYKIPHININEFANGIGCVPFSATFTIGQRLFIGFWTYTGGASKSIAFQSGSGYQYYYNIQGLNSPNVGTPFPNPQIQSSYQILMGFTAGNPQACNSLPCSGCTQNGGCVWCLNTQSCISTAGIPQCPSWTRNPAFCNACQQYKTCDSCANVANNCSWCETNGQPSVCMRTQDDGNCTSAITNPIFCS